MKDFTEELNAIGKAREDSKKRAHDRSVLYVKGLWNAITAYGEEMDIAIANANAALAAGIELETYRSERGCFENGQFYADGIGHRLGFIRSYANKASVVGLGVIGGGWNGDVSVVYKNGEVIYDTDKYYEHNKAYMALHKLENMRDETLTHYKNAFERFERDLRPFLDSFEEYLETAVEEGAAR